MREVNENYDCVYHVSGGESDEENHILSFIKIPILLHQVGYEYPRSIVNEKRVINAYTSHWQSYFFSFNKCPVVPYIIEQSQFKVDDMKYSREDLGLDKEMVIFGRHGGQDTWNLPFASQAVISAVQKRNDIGFIFLNTQPFINHQSCSLYGTSSKDMLESYFINTDAMLHARWEGETFGLSCAEYHQK